MCDVLDVARYFLSINPNLTEKQLQKLVYYSYVWYIAKHNKRKGSIRRKLFKEAPEAWLHGPVFYTLYREMKNNDYQLPMDDGYKSKLSEYKMNFLNVIYDTYGRYSGNNLEAMSCSEEPWRKARKGVEREITTTKQISDIDIYEFYTKE